MRFGLTTLGRRAWISLVPAMTRLPGVENSFTCRIPARNAHDRYKMGHLTPRGGVERETVGSGTFDAAILRDLRRATLP